MAKLAVAELELQNIRGELSATKEKIAQIIDQEKMELQAKLLERWLKYRGRNWRLSKVRKTLRGK